MRGANMVLRLGTRSSLLAMVQSRLVADELRSANPGIDVELVAVETRGDRDRKTPLADVRDGKFFSAELESALLNGDVDFCVHSLKDLGADRPCGIIRAAVPVRENPRDVIVFRGDVIERLARGQPLRLGSSSRRRQSNVESFLRNSLPRFATQPRLRFEPLRGTVDDRLRRIHVPADETGALDGVILALAGLSRLWRDATGRQATRPLLRGVRWMVLPLSACPTAPGQGALAIECRRDDERTRELLATLHDEPTAQLVQRELDLLAGFPDEQKPAVGATALRQHALGPIVYLRGPERDTRRLIWNGPPPPRDARPWDGRRLGANLRNKSLPVRLRLPDFGAVFVAHWHAVTGSVTLDRNARIWTSGITSWRRLAARGLWVEGCADNLGYLDVVPTLECEVLALPPLSTWTVLTHAGAENGWRSSGVGRVLATYTTDYPGPDGGDSGELARLRDAVASATHFYWGNIGQFQAVRQWLPADAHHACGAGKTFEALRAAGLDAPALFPSHREWQSWHR